MTRRLPNANDISVAGAILTQAMTMRSSGALTTPFGSTTGNELAGAAAEIAGSLLQRYPGADAPLIIVMAGDPWTVAALLAADLVGRTAVLLHPSTTAEEIGLASVASRAELLLQYVGAQIRLEVHGASMHTRNGLSWTDLSTDVDPKTHGQNHRNVAAGFLCHQTSGTMGSSKLALRTRFAVLTEMETLRHILTMTEQDVVLCGSAVSHSYGCVGGMLTPLLAGASVRIVRTSEEARAAIVESEPSIVFGLGPMYAQLANGSSDLSQSLRKVRFAFSAGAPLADGLYERFEAQFGVPIRQDYGTSETGTISLDLGEIPRPDSVGEPLPHVDVRLRPPETIPMEPGERGEIVVRSPALAMGYLMGGELVPCVDEWGWYATQDAGSRMDHRLHIHRRLRALPSINGESVSLDSVEKAIAAMPGVLEAVVTPESKLGRTILAAIVATADLTADEIRVWCSQRLPKNWTPDRIVMCERLPRSPAGKILK
jgi:acyl-CoA synthetase (AMP-forming)/AMP-acid ligase II